MMIHILISMLTIGCLVAAVLLSAPVGVIIFQAFCVGGSITVSLLSLFTKKDK